MNINSYICKICFGQKASVFFSRKKTVTHVSDQTCDEKLRKETKKKVKSSQLNIQTALLYQLKDESNIWTPAVKLHQMCFLFPSCWTCRFGKITINLNNAPPAKSRRNVGMTLEMIQTCSTRKEEKWKDSMWCSVWLE